MSGVTCHMSCVTCQVSGVMCHVSHVIFFLSSFFGKSGGASWWRVCSQRGLPRLVFIEFYGLRREEIFNKYHFVLSAQSCVKRSKTRIRKHFDIYDNLQFLHGVSDSRRIVSGLTA